MLSSAKALIQEVGPEALRIGVGIDSRDPVQAVLELELLRAGGRTTLLRLELSDSELSLDSLISIAAGLAAS